MHTPYEMKHMNSVEEQHELKRTMKPSWVFAMALGSAVGWGAFILPFEWGVNGGLGGTVIGFVLGGLIIATIAVSYGLSLIHI